MNAPRKLTLALAALALVPAAQATDGVIEINQAKVTAAGGIPYVISQRGSYRLTSNLTQTNKDTDVIQITADDVTLDLNGFTISGSNSCTQASDGTVSCTAAGIGAGINATGTAVDVRNGHLKGIGGPAIRASLVEDIQVGECGQWGIFALSSVRHAEVKRCATSGIVIFTGGRVSDSKAAHNGGDGIAAETIERSEARSNGSTGLMANLVRDSISASNHGHGIECSAIATNNVVYFNNDYGITGTSNCLVIQNVMTGNTPGNIGGSPHSLTNLCNGVAC